MKAMHTNEQRELLLAQYLEGEISKQALEPLLQADPELAQELQQLELLEQQLRQLPKPNLTAYEPFFDKVEEQLVQSLSSTSISSPPVRKFPSVQGNGLLSLFLGLTGIIGAALALFSLLSTSSVSTSSSVQQSSPALFTHDPLHFEWTLPQAITTEPTTAEPPTVVEPPAKRSTLKLSGTIHTRTPSSPVVMQIQQLQQQLHHDSLSVATTIVLQRQLGILYRENGDFAQSLTWLQRALHTAEQAQLAEQIALTQGELGLTLQAMGKHRESLFFLQQCVRTLRAFHHPAYQRWKQTLQKFAAE